MVYRAKITRIFSFVESNYNLEKYSIVRDSKDAYLEVNSEEEAELLEKLNQLETERCKTALRLYEILPKLNH